MKGETLTFNTIQTIFILIRKEINPNITLTRESISNNFYKLILTLKGEKRWKRLEVEFGA